MEIWEPKPPGTLRTTPGLLQDPFTFILLAVLSLVLLVKLLHRNEVVFCVMIYSVVGISYVNGTVLFYRVLY
jgi:hypothetical protein